MDSEKGGLTWYQGCGRVVRSSTVVRQPCFQRSPQPCYLGLAIRSESLITFHDVLFCAFRHHSSSAFPAGAIRPQRPCVSVAAERTAESAGSLAGRDFVKAYLQARSRDQHSLCSNQEAHQDRLGLDLLLGCSPRGPAPMPALPRGTPLPADGQL
jgi:hypothetical protein